jgi:hypothetical protein
MGRDDLRAAGDPGPRAPYAPGLQETGAPSEVEPLHAAHGGQEHRGHRGHEGDFRADAPYAPYGPDLRGAYKHGDEDEDDASGRYINDGGPDQ